MMDCPDCQDYPNRCETHQKDYYEGMSHAYNNIRNLLLDKNTTRDMINKYMNNEDVRINKWFELRKEL